MLSSLSKSRISIFNAHLTLFVRRMTSHNSINLPWNGASPLADQTSRIVAEVNVGSSACLVNELGTCYGIVTQGPVSIVGKLYQFYLVTVIELRSVSLTTLSFVL